VFPKTNDERLPNSLKWRNKCRNAVSAPKIRHFFVSTNALRNARHRERYLNEM